MQPLSERGRGGGSELSVNDIASAVKAKRAPQAGQRRNTPTHCPRAGTRLSCPGLSSSRHLAYSWTKRIFEFTRSPGGDAGRVQFAVCALHRSDASKRFSALLHGRGRLRAGHDFGE